MRTYSSRSIAVADAIGRHEPFKTHGALSATTSPDSVGYLDDAERELFYADRNRITYAVMSYATPIAWVVDGTRVHIVDQKFSRTTSKHQGKLYRLKDQAPPCSDV